MASFDTNKSCSLPSSIFSLVTGASFTEVEGIIEIINEPVVLQLDSLEEKLYSVEVGCFVGTIEDIWMVQD